MAIIGAFLSANKKPHGLNKPWGVAGCLAVVKAAAIHRKSRRILFSCQKSKKPAPKGNGLIIKPHRPLAHLYSGASNLSNSPL